MNTKIFILCFLNYNKNEIFESTVKRMIFYFISFSTQLFADDILYHYICHSVCKKLKIFIYTYANSYQPHEDSKNEVTL